MLVYIVMARENVYEPSDYPVKVFKNEKDAHEYCKTHDPEKSFFGCYHYEVTELELE